MTRAVPLPGIPDVESPLFEKIFQAKNVSAETREIARKLHKDGYAVLDFPEPALDQLAANIVRSLDSSYDWDRWRKGTSPGLRVQDAWQNVPEVKSVACNPQILQLLSDLYGRRAFPFQTLNFPVGTQQHFHSDSAHFSSCPERFMVGVWLALEDIDRDNGPLVYYPGSHVLPVITNEHTGVNPDTRGDSHSHYTSYERAWEAIVDAQGLKPAYFQAKKGQALIWAANLLHGGAPQNNLRRTRHSQVTHYYFEGCTYYTPLGSVPFLGSIEYREIVDISTGKNVPNMLNGLPVSKEQIHHASFVMDQASVTDPSRPKLPPGFDGTAYLKANPDVAEAQVDPVKHWLEFGYLEGRPLR